MRDNLRARLAKAEQEVAGLSTRAVLEDGTVILIGGTDRFAAVLATLKQEPHFLHGPLQRLASVQEDPDLHAVASIISALERGSDEG